MAVYYIEFYFLSWREESGERKEKGGKRREKGGKRRENTIKNMLPCLRTVLSPLSSFLSKTLFGTGMAPAGRSNVSSRRRSCL